MNEALKTGLLGEKLSHSLSPEIHRLISGSAYALFEKAPAEVGEFVKSSPLDGYNVTVPYKKAVIPFLDRLSEEAELTGAVNTIINRNGIKTGYNTDVYGFIALLKKTGTDIAGKRAVILGNGGAAAAVKAALNRLNAGEIITVSRTGETNYSNVYDIKSSELLVNTTPLGMFPNTDAFPLELKNFDKIGCVIDLIYNPMRTPLLIEAEEYGIKAYNGLYMLVAQAVKSSELFFSANYPEETIEKVYKSLSASFENIALIGMPGAGKTSIGKILSQATGKKFIDTDEEITKTYGTTPESIIINKGEKYFRSIEKEIIAKASKNNGSIISVGGGAVTQYANIFELKKYSRLIFIDRPLNELEIKNRPLSLSVGVDRLFEQRYGLYEKYADITIKSSATPEKTAKEILSILNTGCNI